MPMNFGNNRELPDLGSMSGPGMGTKEKKDAPSWAQQLVKRAGGGQTLEEDQVPGGPVPGGPVPGGPVPGGPVPGGQVPIGQDLGGGVEGLTPTGTGLGIEGLDDNDLAGLEMQRASGFGLGLGDAEGIPGFGGAPDFEKPPGPGSLTQPPESGPDPLDQRYEELLSDHESGWANIRDQILDQGAEEERRFAERAAQSGFSAGGYMAGGEAELALGRVQTLANARADHETQRRNLQLAWLEKKVDQSFEREMNAEQTKQQLLFSILESGEPITPDQLNALIGGGVLDRDTADAIGGGTDVGDTTYYEDDDGVWYFQDAEGNRVDWEPEGAERYPGDPLLYNAAGVDNPEGTFGIYQQGYSWGEGRDDAEIQYEGSDYPAGWVTHVEPILTSVANSAGLDFSEMKSIPMLMGEAGLFISKYMGENGGREPSSGAVLKHLRAAQLLE